MERILKHEKVRFLLAGGLNTGLDFLFLNILVFLFNALPLVANTISVIIGITISYFLNHYFVFKSTETVTLKKYFMFFLATGFSSLIIQSVIILGFAAFFQTDFSRSLFVVSDSPMTEFVELNIAKAVAVVIGMVWNFLIYKYFIFKDRTASVPTASEEADDSEE